MPRPASSGNGAELKRKVTYLDSTNTLYKTLIFFV
jgi:hypothetical protein